jgi:hypothetical protein
MSNPNTSQTGNHLSTKVVLLLEDELVDRHAPLLPKVQVPGRFCRGHGCRTEIEPAMLAVIGRPAAPQLLGESISAPRTAEAAKIERRDEGYQLKNACDRDVQQEEHSGQCVPVVR